MQSNKNFYEGQKIFIGIDVHARQWHAYASPISSIGTKAVCMPPSAEALLAYLQNKFPGGEYYSAYESGFCGFTKHRQLLEIGINNIVFNASDLKKSNKERVRVNFPHNHYSIPDLLRINDFKTTVSLTIEHQVTQSGVRLSDPNCKIPDVAI